MGEKTKQIPDLGIRYGNSEYPASAMWELIECRIFVNLETPESIELTVKVEIFSLCKLQLI